MLQQRFIAVDYLQEHELPKARSTASAELAKGRGQLFAALVKTSMEVDDVPLELGKGFAVQDRRI